MFKSLSVPMIALLAFALVGHTWAQEREREAPMRGPADLRQSEPVMPESRYERPSTVNRESAGERAQQWRERQYNREMIEARDLRARDHERFPRVPNQHQSLDRHGAMDLRSAIDSVQRSTHGKILGAETLHMRGSSVHRIKVYTPEGRVRVVQVPARTEPQVPVEAPKEEH